MGRPVRGARMICTLVAQGKTVGVVANSHAVVRNLLNKVIKAADETGVDVPATVPNVGAVRNRNFHRLMLDLNLKY